MGLENELSVKDVKSSVNELLTRFIHPQAFLKE